MPVSEEIFYADTIRPVEEAFKAGDLLMGLSPSEAAAPVLQWIDFPLNWLMLLACVLSGIFFLNRIIGLLPFIVGGLFRWKEIVNLESNIRLKRDRDAVAVIAVFVIVLAASRFEIYTPSYILLFPPNFKTLAVLGAAILFLLIREIFIIGLAPRSFSMEQYRLANNSIYNFIIFSAIITVFIMSTRFVFNINPLIIKSLLLGQIALSYCLFLIRKTQIMIKVCSHITAFLYLCSLELLPAGLLIASGIVL